MKTLITLLAVTIIALTVTSRAADAVKPYPLTTCIVSKDGLTEMGKPVMLVYQGQEMKFCCKKCVKKFNEDPSKYIKALQDAPKK
ncbi:MAG: YHS domain-containing protein [Nitrospirota bacterium]